VAKFSGIWPALVTPLTSEGRIDKSAAEALIEALLATGIGGLYVCGGTGEGVLLPPEARLEMARTAIGVVSGRVPVMVHIGAITTEAAVALAKEACAAGADALSAAEVHGTTGGARMGNVAGSFYDFAAFRHRGTAAEQIAAPPDPWGGRAAVAWAARLAAGERFDRAEAEGLLALSRVIDAIYAQGRAGS